MINQIYRQRGKRRREGKIIGYKRQYMVGSYKRQHMSNRYERILITSSGNVGISNINPSYKMHIGK